MSSVLRSVRKRKKSRTLGERERDKGDDDERKDYRIEPASRPRVA